MSGLQGHAAVSSCAYLLLGVDGHALQGGDVRLGGRLGGCLFAVRLEAAEVRLHLLAQRHLHMQKKQSAPRGRIAGLRIYNNLHQLLSMVYKMAS